MNRNDITKILEGSFDAGFLIDGSKGAILFANEAAEELFGLTAGTPGRFSKSIGSVASFLSFYAYSALDFIQGRKDILEWSQVLKYVKNDPEGAPEEWIVSGTRQDQTTFPGVIRLTIFSSNLVVAYVRHKDKHQAIVTSQSSVSAGGDSQNRQRRFTEEADASTNAMVTIDEKGNILMVNRAAIDTVTWCRENQVGKHIVEAAGWQSLPPSPHQQPGPCPPTLVDVVAEQPSMTVDEDGIVLAINQAAIDTISWCHVDLVGHHLPSLGGESTDGGKPGMEQRSSSHRARLGRWSFRQQSSKSSSFSKSSPQVLRLMIQPTRCNDDLDKESQKQASDAESILLAIFEASLDPLFQTNEKGTIQMVNSAATKLFGWSREDFLGSNISMICGGAHGNKHNRYMARYLATGDTRVMNTRRELPAKRQDGTEFPIELALIEADTFLGDERLFCGFVRDLTNVKEEARAQLRKY